MLENEFKGMGQKERERAAAIHFMKMMAALGWEFDSADMPAAYADVVAEAITLCRNAGTKLTYESFANPTSIVDDFKRLARICDTEIFPELGE